MVLIRAQPKWPAGGKSPVSRRGFFFSQENSASQPVSEPAANRQMEKWKISEIVDALSVATAAATTAAAN